MKAKILGYFLLLAPLIGNANYTVKIDLTEKGLTIPEKWTILGLVYGNWTNDGSYYNCQSWTPFTLRQLVGVNMTQNATCSQNQTRIVNEKQQNPVTKVTREVYKTTETQKITTQATRTVQGTRQPAVGTCEYSMTYGQYSFVVVSPQGIANLVYKGQSVPGFDATKSSIVQYNGKTYSIGGFLEGSGSNEVYTSCSN